MPEVRSLNTFDALTRALEYIERNLINDINMTELAKYSCVSLSALQKIFVIRLITVLRICLKRRLTAAAGTVGNTEYGDRYCFEVRI